MFTDMDMDDSPADFRDSFTQDSPRSEEVRQALLGDEGTAKSSSRWRTWKCCACCTCGVIVTSALVMGLVFYFLIRGGYFAKLPPGDLVNTPGAPTAPEVYVVETTYIGLSWVAPADTGGATLLGFEIEGATTDDPGAPPPDDSPAWQVLGEVVGNVRSFGQGGLEASSSHCYRVTGRNNAGLGNTSAPACFTTGAPIPPEAPPTLFPTATSTTTLSMEWGAANGSGSALVGYTLQYCEPGVTGDGSATEEQCVAGTDTAFGELYSGGSGVVSYTAVDLAEGAAFWWRVASETTVGLSPWSAPPTRLRTDSAGATAPPMTDPPALQQASPTTLTLEWPPLETGEQDGGAQVLEYELVAAAAAGGGGGARRLGLGLLPSARHINHSMPAALVVSESVPTAVGPAQKRAVGGAVGALRSEAAALLRRLEWGDGGSSTSTSTSRRRGRRLQIDFSGFDTSHTAAGLSASTELCFTLSARNNVGESDASNTGCFSTSAATPPDAPSGLWVFASTSSQVSVAWDVAFDNGDRVLSYELQMDDWWLTSEDFVTVGDTGPDPDSRELVVTGWPSRPSDDALLPAVPLRMRVRGRNGAGEGEWSEVLETQTDVAGFCGVSALTASLCTTHTGRSIHDWLAGWLAGWLASWRPATHPWQQWCHVLVVSGSPRLSLLRQNAPDMLVFRNSHSTLQGQIQGCLLGCALNPDPVECAASCVVTQVGLQRPCAGCWANMGRCTLDRCLLPCLNPNSDACFECSEQNCFPDTVVCTGIPLWAFPR
jgi:hypothetical protein